MIAELARRLVWEARWRARVLADGRAFPLSERIATASRWHRRSIEQRLRRCLRRDGDGAQYFAIGGQKLFFHLPAEGQDPPRLLEGALLVLKEAFVEAPELYHGEVRVRPGDVVLDLGGHIGTAALALARSAGEGGRVFTFEPVFHDALARNVRESGSRNVEVIPKAVAERSGVCEFAVKEHGIDSRIGGGDGATQTRQVPTISLDEFAAERSLSRVDFIKVDIEGAEELAIEGARDLIARCRPKWSIASYHSRVGRPGVKQHETLVAMLRERGYRVHELDRRRIYAW